MEIKLKEIQNPKYLVEEKPVIEVRDEEITLREKHEDHMNLMQEVKRLLANSGQLERKHYVRAEYQEDWDALDLWFLKNVEKEVLRRHRVLTPGNLEITVTYYPIKKGENGKA